MMFFNFSQFFANQGPNLLYEEFLKTEELTLEQILAHEDTVTEVKKANAGLVAFLGPQIPRLIEYVRKEPREDAGEMEGRRYPFVASEILNSEAMLGELGKEGAMLSLVFQYLQSETPLNLTLVGYCTSLSQRVLERQSLKVLEFLFNSETDYTPYLLQHMENRAIAELVVNVLLVNSQFQARAKLLHSLLLAFDPGMKREKAVNVSFTLQEIIKRSADVGEWRSLISTLLFTEVLEKLAQAVTWPEIGDQVATVLTAFLSHSAFEEVATYFTEVCEAGFQAKAAIQPIAAAALSALAAPRSSQLQATTYGIDTAALGQHRLALILLLNTCMRVVGTELDALLVQGDYVQLCTKLFREFPWHSGLHLAYESLVKIIIEEGSQTLKAELVEKSDLIAVLSEAGLEINIGGKHRKGYLGHITRIANTLLSASASFPYFRQQLEGDLWINFAVSYLIPQNRIETSKYPSRKESDISDVQPIEDIIAAAEKEEADNEGAFEFKVTENTFTPEDLDKQHLFNFGNEEISPDPEMESAQGSDAYNDFSYWKVPVGDAELEELE